MLPLIFLFPASFTFHKVRFLVLLQGNLFTTYFPGLSVDIIAWDFFCIINTIKTSQALDSFFFSFNCSHLKTYIEWAKSLTTVLSMLMNFLLYLTFVCQAKPYHPQNTLFALAVKVRVYKIYENKHYITCLYFRSKSVHCICKSK